MRARLIDAAWDLFSSVGYDKTTIEAIIERVNVSKGAFYHYFTGKEEMLDAVIERMITLGTLEAEQALEDQTLPAIARLNRLLAASRKWRMDNIGAVLAVAEVLYRDENIIIRHKVDRKISALMIPLLSNILEQGVQEGVFELLDPGETARLLLGVMSLMAEIQTLSLLDESLGPNGSSLAERRARLYIQSIERILGARNGSVEPVDPEVFQTILKQKCHEDQSGREESHGTSDDSHS